MKTFYFQMFVLILLFFIYYLLNLLETLESWNVSEYWTNRSNPNIKTRWFSQFIYPAEYWTNRLLQIWVHTNNVLIFANQIKIALTNDRQSIKTTRFQSIKLDRPLFRTFIWPRCDYIMLLQISIFQSAQSRSNFIKHPLTRRSRLFKGKFQFPISVPKTAIGIRFFDRLLLRFSLVSTIPSTRMSQFNDHVQVAWCKATIRGPGSPSRRVVSFLCESSMASRYFCSCDVCRINSVLKVFLCVHFPVQLLVIVFEKDNALWIGCIVNAFMVRVCI